MHYRAYFKTEIEVLELPENPKEDTTITIRLAPEAESVTAKAILSARANLDKGNIPLGSSYAKVWVRSDYLGKLTKINLPRLPLRKEVEKGETVGNLIKVKPEENIITVTIHPNNPKSKMGLRKRFTLNFKTSNEIIKTCEDLPLNQGVRLDCHIDKETLTLVATDIEVVKVAPSGFKPKPEPQ